MCGIIGVLGTENVAPRLMEALARLEYRGYDSAGIATLEAGVLVRRRAAGKLNNLRDLLVAEPLQGKTGIGHTRWATHGEPTKKNAHPHMAGPVMVVHNGIIENFRTLREELAQAGYACTTETDSETIAQLISSNLATGASPQEAVHQALGKLEGAFAIAVLFEGEEDLLVGARKGSPLVIGVGEGEMFLGSDALAVGPFTSRVVYLEEGDWCVLTRKAYQVFDAGGREVARAETLVTGSAGMVDKGNYRHFMQKEIFEQPEATARTIGHYLDPLAQTVELGETGAVDLSQIKGIQMVACGTSYYACMVAEYWFEQIAGIPVKIDVLPILAGPEIGVASTKAFTAMLCALASAVLAIGKAKGTLSRADELEMIAALEAVPRMIGEALQLDGAFADLARDLVKARDVLYLGRGVHYPIAMEGALKLKEISYIHAEGYASGELKHGPIALIDEETPIVFVAPYDRLFDKSLSNLQEVVARRGRVVLLSDERGVAEAGDAPEYSVTVPTCADFIAPILYSVPVQLLAYHIAVEKGTDVDQPRNLAKSVTVE